VRLVLHGGGLDSGRCSQGLTRRSLRPVDGPRGEAGLPETPGPGPGPPQEAKQTCPEQPVEIRAHSRTIERKVDPRRRVLRPRAATALAGLVCPTTAGATDPCSRSTMLVT